jgi:hypothetical protein
MGLDQYIIRKRNGDNIHQLDYRKFPALHGYMQEHSTDPVFDNKFDIFVRGTITIDTLKELSQLALDILDNKVSVEFMTQSFGPLFGSNDYDEWFFEDLKNLSEELQEFITLHQDMDEYEYDSWW